MSPFPIPCVSRKWSDPLPPVSLNASATSEATNQLVGLAEKYSERGEDDWVRDINTLLKFNASFGGRGTLSGNGGFEEDED